MKAFATLALAGLPIAVAAQAPAPSRPPLTTVWMAKPVASPFLAPNRPHWKLAEILAAHARQANWTQPLVRDPGGLSAAYIQLAPGGHTRSMLYEDASAFWVVQAGQIRFTIEGQPPFVASKGFVVQVPARVLFSMETVGDQPSLRFEVTHTRASPAYPVADVPPTAGKGMRYVRASFAGGPGSYGGAKPYLDFDKESAVEGWRAPQGFVRDGETSANIIRGRGIPRPADSDPGHFHDGTSEFWFILEGHLSLLIEGEQFIDSAPQGDILYAPAGRWHRTSFTGPGMSTRISIHPVAAAVNNLDPEHSAAAGN